MPKTKKKETDRIEVRISTKLKNDAIRKLGRGLSKYVRDSLAEAVRK